MMLKTTDNRVVVQVRRGFIFVVVIGILVAMLLLALALSFRSSSQMGQTVIADQSMIARYFLESYISDILWQIRNRRNIPQDPVFNAFRSGTGVTALEVKFSPGKAVSDLARDLNIKIGPCVAYFDELKALPHDSSAFRTVGENHEKRGFLGITCQATYENREFMLDVRYPFKVVMQATPVLRKFLLFFNQLHLEQESPFGIQDGINIVPIRQNRARSNRTPITLFGWDFLDREKNGYVFLGDDDHNIYLNLVGGVCKDDGESADLEDLWQISPSAFEISSGLKEFNEEALLNDNEGNTVFVRGAAIPLAYRGHFARFGILGFSNELARSEFLGDFKLERFLRDDPSFVELQRNPQSLEQAAVIRLFGHRDSIDFSGYEREVFGKVFARFFLLSFFEAPSVGSPIAFSENPDQQMDFDQYGGGQRIAFKPERGKYCNYMSRLVSGGIKGPSIAYEASIPLYRDPELTHKILAASDFKSCDGLVPAAGFSAIPPKWFPDGPYTGPGGRPKEIPESIYGRITRFFKTASDFKKAVGLEGSDRKKCWIDGVVYIHEPLDLRDGIETADIRGGIVLVRGRITLGNVVRGTSLLSAFAGMKNISQDKLLTFVSLTGDNITLTGNRYFGVQLYSFRPELTRPLEQISFQNGANFMFLGGIGVSTPCLERISSQLKSRELFPIINAIPAMAADNASYTVRISEKVGEYEFSVTESN